MAAKILTVAIEKGGAGKTTTAVHAAFYAAEMGWRTLVVDLDTQKNATQTLVPNLDADSYRTARDLYDPVEPPKPILRVSENLDLLPSDDALDGVERLPLEEAGNFRKRLVTIAKDYDLVVVDTPPTRTFSTLCPMMASHYVISPVVPHDYSIAGAENVLTRIDQIKRSSNPGLRFLGILINCWNRRDSDENEIVQDFRTNLSKFIVPHALGKYVAISRIAKTKQPVWKGAKSGAHRKAATEVRTVMKWVLDQTMGNA